MVVKPQPAYSQTFLSFPLSPLMATALVATFSTIGASISSPNVTHFLKQTDSNYIIWLSQMKLLLLGHNLFRYVDGFVKATTDTIPTIADKLEKPNPEFATQFQVDPLVVSHLASTLLKPILSLTVGKSSSKALWDCLYEHFSQASIANVANLRFQLLALTKGCFC